ncbi:MAG: FAD-binding oxidoreductase [Saprospiraceae bacterium]|jgi:glycine oxidase|nr:FAD-binding oxidoreductase [Saprospiraceae bacterium]
MRKFDYIVVGQGIAGTLMAWNLHLAGQKVLIIDNHHIGSSSIVAAGIVNPITGKNYVTSWRIQEFLPVALQTYDALNQHYGFMCYTHANILRALYSGSDENTWLAKSAEPDMKQFICEEVDLDTYTGKVHQQLSYGELQGTFYVNMAMIMSAVQAEWTTQEAYMKECFQYDQLNISPDGFLYKENKSKGIIFCEGYKANSNPYFPKIGLAPSKGEVLIVKIPSAGFKKMYKDGIFFVPQGDDTYWVGSGYERNATDDHPTQKNYDILAAELERVLKVPYEIIGHKAAIRPTMQNRRPIFKEHENIEGMYLFNGLGTKGASIGPFYATQSSRYIVEKNAGKYSF